MVTNRSSSSSSSVYPSSSSSSSSSTFPSLSFSSNPTRNGYTLARGYSNTPTTVTSNSLTTYIHRQQYLRRITLTILVTIGIGAWFITHTLRTTSTIQSLTSTSSSSNGGGGKLSSSSSSPPLASSSTLSYLCSHKLANNAHEAGPLTYATFLSQFQRIVIDQGISCVDLDVTYATQIPKVSSSSSSLSGTTEDHILLGHPEDIAEGIKQGLINTENMIEFWAGLNVFIEYAEKTLLTVPHVSPFCFTLELKGNLRTDKLFIQKLADTLKNHPAVCYGILGLAYKDTVAPSSNSRVPSSLKLAYPMRDNKQAIVSTDNTQNKADNDNDPTLYPCDIFPNEPKESILKRLQRYSVLMPSIKCLENISRQSIINEYKVLPNTALTNGSDKGYPSVQRDVRTWTVDSCKVAKDVIKLGSTHIITNEVFDFIHHCTLP